MRATIAKSWKTPDAYDNFKIGSLVVSKDVMPKKLKRSLVMPPFEKRVTFKTLHTAIARSPPSSREVLPPSLKSFLHSKNCVWILDTSHKLAETLFNVFVADLTSFTHNLLWFMLHLVHQTSILKRSKKKKHQKFSLLSHRCLL